MFDRTASAAWGVGAAPYVYIAVLTALATPLQDVTSVSGAPSQLRDSSAALGSHDANRGDVHAAPAYPSPPSSQQCTSVRSVLRPAHAAAETPQWQALPGETRHTLTKLMVRLIFGHAGDDLAREREEMRYDV
jgi:hypothetical protein